MCAYRVYGKAGRVERQGSATLHELAAAIAAAQQVVVWLAATDVTLLRMPVPPLPPARLHAALPNLLEERLLAEVADCVFGSTAEPGPLRTLAVTQRAWLEDLLQTLRRLGARHIRALPAQLSLPCQAGRVSAQIQEPGPLLTLRPNEHEGWGVLLDASTPLLSGLRALVPELPVTLYVPAERLAHYHALLAADDGIEVLALPATAPVDTTLDLAAHSGQARQSIDWLPWRWPLLLAAMVLLLQAAALNFDWWHLNREARDLRASLKQLYLDAYPKESVVLDPLLQMRQKLDAARHDAGLGAPDDFTRLLAEFAQARAATQQNAEIAGIEYHARTLSIRLKSPAPMDALRAELAQRRLKLEAAPDSELSWLLRSQP